VIAPASRGFTLLELVVVMLVLAILAAAIAVPLSAQAALRRQDDTRHLLAEAREAILGFASANGRLPCPASATSRGQESFEPGGDALSGNCSNFHDGFLPGATLGLAPLDADGYVRDAWGTEANRIRYAVFGDGQSIGGITNPLTRANGMQFVALPALGAAPRYLLICATGSGVSANSCGAASNQLTRRAAFVLLSLGANAPATPPRGSDESRNLDGDSVFVSREAGPDFDDLVTWVPVTLLVSRLVASGRLP
jgi:prepilin-type N-terminal cleavage/methylation domain-containing protein